MAWVFSLILHNMERRIRKLIRVSAITVGALLLTGFVVVASLNANKESVFCD